jgi:phosphoglycerol transferase MdoB-like AlkP superfamily enzyme
MLMRAAEELNRMTVTGPTFALLQTLSNHAPFNLPPPAPFHDITGPQQLVPRLNGISYADWALGKFFDMVSKQPWFSETLFVILGDHGFPFESKQAELDLDDYHVPLLIYYPGDLRYAGRRIHSVASQVDVLPTSLGVLGLRDIYQAWGRDMFRLDSSDPGWAVIKPAGNSQKVAFVQGESLLVMKPGFNPDLWKFELNPWHAVKIADQSTMVTNLSLNLSSYLNTALSTLLNKRAGIAPDKILSLTMDRSEPYAYK